MQDNSLTLVTDREKAPAFNRTYATVSRQVRINSIDRWAKKLLKEDNVRACRECKGGRTGFYSPFTEELMRQISSSQLRIRLGPMTCATSISGIWVRWPEEHCCASSTPRGEPD